MLARDVRAIFGAHDLSDNYEPGRVPYSPTEIILHNEWNPHTTAYDADIAILRFESGKILFSEYVQPICLWDSTTIPSETVGVVIGWGKSDDTTKLHEKLPKLAELPMHSNEDCFLETPKLAEISSRRTFCAGLKNGTGVCFGDSGGGFVIKVKKINYLKGIVSSSLIEDGMCDVTKFAVYTDVLKYKSWIDGFIDDVSKLPAPQHSGELKNVFFSVMAAGLGFKTNFFFIQIIILESKGVVTCDVQNYQFPDHFFPEESDFAQRDFPETCFIDDQAIPTTGYVVQPVQNVNIKAIRIEGRNVKFLPEGVGENFPNLSLVYILETTVETIGSRHFKGMHNLRLAFVSKNKITSVSPTAFKDLNEVRRMDLNVNPSLESLPDGVFDSLVELRTLYLNKNKLRTLPENIFSKLENMRLAYLDNNNLSEIPAKLFQRNLKLQRIVLYSNKIQRIDPRFINDLSALKAVFLKSNLCVNATFRPSEFSNMKLHILEHC